MSYKALGCHHLNPSSGYFFIYRSFGVCFRSLSLPKMYRACYILFLVNNYAPNGFWIYYLNLYISLQGKEVVFELELIGK